MKLLKKAAVLIAVLIMAVWSISMVLAESASTAVFTQDGIETQLMLDKTDYKDGETVEVSVRIRNTNLSDVKNVKSVLVLPDQFSSKTDTVLEKSILRAGENMGTSYQVINAANPKTGSVFSAFFNLLMVLASLFLLITLLKSKYIRKKSLSVTLCFALLLPLLGQTGVQASDVFGKSYSVRKAFKMGQATYEVKANVTYGELLTNGPELSSVSPSVGSFGSNLVLSGAGFTDGTSVLFKSDALGEISVTPTLDENGNLCVVSPTIYVETVKIYAVTDKNYSNPLDFHVVALPLPNGQEFEEFSEAFDSVFDEFGNELENIYKTGDTSQSLQEQQQMISELQTAMKDDIAYFNTLLTEEDRVFVNQLFASEALLGATKRLEQAAYVLSHSTTSEALDNIEKTKDLIDELIGVLKEIKEVVNTIKIAAVAATVALAVVSVFTGGAAAEAAVQAAKIANNCRKIVNNLLNPAIIGLSAIRALLELAPTIAVGDSLTTADYEGDISINQYFGSLEASVRNPIKSLVSYSSTFGTLPASAEQGETILENLDRLIDEFAGTNRNSTEEQVTASFNDNFNKFIFDETLETLSENGVPSQNASILPENPLTLSLQDYIKTYFPETYLACIQKDKERHEFEAKNGLIFKSLFGTSVMLKEAFEQDNYTAAGDIRGAADYQFNWSFEAVLNANHYWSFLEDSDTSAAKETIIREVNFSAISFAKQISDSLTNLRKFWNSANYDLGTYVAGDSERILFTQAQNSALNKNAPLAAGLEALKDKTADEKTAGFKAAFADIASIRQEINGMIYTVSSSYQSLNIIQNSANLKTIDKFLETGFADIKPGDADGRKLLEISSILNSGYEEMADVKTLFDLTNSDFNEFVEMISPLTDNEIKNLIEKGEKSDEALVAYVGEPYSFKAHMDYTTPENANIDFILDKIWDDLADIAVSEISEYLPESLDIASNFMNYLTEKVVSKVLQYVVDNTVGEWTRDAIKEYISLTNVYVDIVLDSDNEAVIPDSRGSRVTLRPLKTGTANVKIYPAGITDPEVLKVSTIERQVNVVSGDNQSEPYDEGAKITGVLDKSGNPVSAVYIGSDVQLKGEGFSLYPSDTTKQRLSYFLPTSGFTPFQNWMLGESDYINIRFEVPDALPGALSVEVKGSEINKWWRSNSLLDILAPTLSTRLSSAFAGEGLTVTGNGFSHTPQNNKVYLNNQPISIRDLPGGFSIPNVLEDITVTAYNHGGVTQSNQHGEGTAITEEEGFGRLHKKLNIIVPEDTSRSESTPIKVSLFDNQLSSNTNTLAIRKFYEEATLTQIGYDARRPDLAVNPATGDAVMVWARTKNAAPAVFSAKLSKTGGTLYDETKVSEDVGGVEYAPISPKIVFANNKYFLVWSDKSCDIVFSYSADGTSWSAPQKIEATANIDKNISAAATDTDGDGDDDLVITYTAQGLTETDRSSVRMAYINTASETHHFVVFAKTIGVGDNDYSDITAKDGQIAVAYSSVNLANHTGNLYYNCGRIADYVDSGSISWQTVINNSDDADTFAEHPELAITVSGGTANVFITWENVAVNGKEDVYFASYRENVKVIHPKNLTDSRKQSQSPQIFTDGNGVLGIIWVETGYSDNTNPSQTGFTSSVYMTRSFDMGESFNMPFMKLATATDGERIALPCAAAYGNANTLMAWQRGNIYQETGIAGQEQAYKINLLTSDRILSDTTIGYTGDYTEVTSEYLLRSYSTEVPDSTADMLYPENVKNGDLFLSKLDGSSLFRLTRRGRVKAIAEAAVNGRGLLYGLDDSVIVSEADGENPIVIYHDTAMNVVGGKWFETYPNRSGSSGANKKLHALLTGEKVDGKAEEMLVTLRSDGARLPESDAESMYSTGFTWKDKVQSSFNSPQSGTNYYNKLVRWQIFDFGMNAASKAAFVEYSGYTPYDSSFKEVYCYTQGGTIKTAVREYSESYSRNAPETIAANGIMPFLNPNDTRLLYISKTDDSLQIVDNISADSPVSRKISADGSAYAYPKFSSSAEWVLSQQMKVGAGMKIAVISPETGDTYYVGPESGVSGYASTFRIGKTKLQENFNYSTIKENGASVPYTLRLAEAQTVPVTVKIRSTDPRITVTPAEITLNPSETVASFTVKAADDLQKQGDKAADLVASVDGGSRSYDGASVQRSITIIDEDSLDVTAPTWPQITKAGVDLRPKNVLDFNVKWTAAYDGGRPIKEYVIKAGDEEIGRTSTTSFVYSMPYELDIAHLNIYGVDCGDNLTPPLAVDIDSSDQMAPFVENLDVTKVETDSAEITLSVRDNIQVGLIKVFKDGTLLFETLKTVGTKTEVLRLENLSVNTQYDLEVVVYDTNSTPSSHTLSFKTKYGYSHVSFESTTALLTEGGSTIVTLIRTGDIDEMTDVPLVFEDVTASKFVDYGFDAGYISFQPGEDRQTVTLVATPPYDDLMPEQNESFKIKFGTIINGTPASENTECTVTIIDNEVPVNKVEMASADYIVSEDAGSVDIVVRHISNLTSGGFSVDYRFSNGSATNGSDYTGISGTLVFAAGETEKTITVPILNDGVYETDYETFTVYLKESANSNGVQMGTKISSTVRINEVTSAANLPLLAISDNNTQNPSLLVNNILGGGRLKVYKLNETTSDYEEVPTLYVGSYPPTTDSWSIPINVSGTYVVTHIDAQERESGFSNAVTVTVIVNQIVRPPLLSANVSIVTGTNTGTIKLIISGMTAGKVYYYGVGYNNMQETLVENDVYASRQMDFPNEITTGEIDNISAEAGMYLNIGELTPGQAVMIYGYTFTACSSYYIGGNNIKK